jgi:hypothetical protein
MTVDAKMPTRTLAGSQLEQSEQKQHDSRKTAA